MATNTQINRFLTTIVPLVQEEARKRKASGKNWVLPSVCIAQAALETGWGTSSLMTKAKAYFGIKAGITWKGKRYNAKTKECYDKVNLVTITDSFRAYNSLKESIADYYKLICDGSRYKKACNLKDARKAITAIKNGGYATAPDYIENVMSVIDFRNLTQYDKVVTEDSKLRYKTKRRLRVRQGAALKTKAIGVIGKNKVFEAEQIQNKIWAYSNKHKGWIATKHCTCSKRH